MALPGAASPDGFGVLLTLAYRGTGFAGFAAQPGQRTIAGELEGAARSIDPHASAPRGVSRTDAGVHARGQRVAFDTRRLLPPRAWVHELNRQLPEEITVLRAARVPAGWDPRDHVLSKTYHYTVLRSPVRDPLLHGTVWRIDERLNHALMEREAQDLVGEHDFAAFRSASDPRSDTVRRVLAVNIAEFQEDPRLFRIAVTGDRFLHHMVRIVVGTLIDVARGRLEPGAVRRAFEERDRRALGITAPPDGLVLHEVALREEGDDAWPSS